MWWLASRRYRRSEKRAQEQHRQSIEADPHYHRWREWLQARTEYSRFLSAVERKEYDARRATERWWKSLDGWRFEKELALLLGRRGYTVDRRGGSGDGGIDLVLHKDGATILVQCKAHTGNTSRRAR
jgi:hypothetical protein